MKLIKIEKGNQKFSIFHSQFSIIIGQFFANVYMNDFDNYIMRTLKVKSYIRYVDDFVLFHSDKNQFLLWKQKIENYLQDYLDLKLRDDYKLKKVREGLDFLGYIIRPDYILVRKRVVNNYKYKKAKFLDEYEKSEGYMSLEEIKNFLSVQASFLGHCKHANSYNLKTKIGEIDEQKYIDTIVHGESLATCRVSKR